ncbi:hypothetical protein, partial [Pediococcus acidilactici]
NSFIKLNFSNAVYLDLDIQKSLHDYQMNYVISSDNHKGIITLCLNLGINGRFFVDTCKLNHLTTHQLQYD